MASFFDRLKQVIQETHRRSLWQVLGIYILGSWIALQVVQTLTESLGMPLWFPQLAVVLLIIGLPVVLATAFVQEGIGPTSQPREASLLERGERTTEAVPPSGAHRFFTWRNAVFSVITTFALWGVVAALWVVLGGTVAAPDRGEATTEDEAVRIIAVLPFENLSTDEENAFFADGIHEDVLTHLSKIADLTVISRTSVLPYRETDLSLGEIAAELGVGSILEGSVRRAGDNVRITAQLIDAGTDQHIWADSFDRGLTAANVFAIQTEIARQIVNALRATLSPEEETRIASVPTASLTAYDFYLKGREAYQRYLPDDNDEAIRLFREALALDPEYARAWAGLGDAFGQRVERFGFPVEWADSAIAASERAIEIDPQLADGYKALGLAYSVRGERDQALNSYRKTVELDPSHTNAAYNIGLLSFQRGEFDEYVRWSRRAFSVAPTLLRRRLSVAWSYWTLGEYDLAERWAGEALALAANDLGALDFASALASHRGDFERGLDLAEQAVREHPNVLHVHQVAAGAALFARDWARMRIAAEEAARLDARGFAHHWHFTSTMLGFALLATGETERGRTHLTATLERIESVALERDNSWESLWEMASIHAVLGNPDAALRWAERAYEERGYLFPRFIAIDPFVDDLRDDPRFQALLGRMEADVEAMRRQIEREEIAAGLR